jgi:hypothetical protein
MLRVELVGAAIALTLIWIITIIFTLTQGGLPPSGMILCLVTIAMGGMWGSVWAFHTRALLTRHRAELDELRRRVRELEEDRDVDIAISRLTPHLRVVSREHN